MIRTDVRHTVALGALQASPNMLIYCKYKGLRKIWTQLAEMLAGGVLEPGQDWVDWGQSSDE
ncbi:MAG TPA: hypothetical protein PLS23_07735 [Phycisphaerae bacterium]|nr:hypothetical protein [Phycisphaerae bacterium]